MIKEDLDILKKELLVNPDGTYLVHDNRERPFKVIIMNKSIVDIYMLPKKLTPYKDIPHEFWNDGYFHTRYMMNFIGISKIFIGLSYVEEMYIGNTILLYIGFDDIKKKHKYIYIERNISEVYLDEEILEYYSNIGNNDVPYPIGVGKTNIYSFTFMEYIPIRMFTSGKHFGDDDVSNIFIDTNKDEKNKIQYIDIIKTRFSKQI